MTGEGSEPQKWRTYRPDKTPDAEVDSTPAPAPVSRPPSTSAEASSKAGGDKAAGDKAGVARRKRIGLAIAGAVGAAVIALIVWIVADAANPPRPQEVDGFNDFRAEAKKEFGDQVYGLLVYEGYAVVEVPAIPRRSDPASSGTGRPRVTSKDHEEVRCRDRARRAGAQRLR